MTNNQRIYKAAYLYLSVSEIAGPKSNPLITGWIKQSAQWLDGDDSKTAWCGCFRGALGLETGTGVPVAHYRARNWLAWGVPVDHKKPELWQPGDTIIMSRSGGHHVCLFDSRGSTPSLAHFLGGNQANKVGINAYALDRVIGVRRAPDDCTC